MPGVICVLTGEEVAELTDPFPVSVRPPYNQLADYCMAVGTVKHAGEAVCAVVAESPYLAWDAAERVEVSYEPLEPVADPVKALEPGATKVHDNLPSNEVWSDHFAYGDTAAAFEAADVIVEDDPHFHRFSSMPLETTAVIASYEPAEGLATVWSNNQRPMLNLPFIAPALRMSSANMRFICPDIGGGFGIKNNSYPYIVCLVLLAKKAGRPVKWVESRTEHMLASTHGNEVRFSASIAMRRDGTILGVRARAIHDEGCYMRREPVGAINFIRHATVGYNFRSLDMDVVAVLTNKAPVGPNRSYGKMQQCYLIERLIDSGARELGLDPIDVRFKNFVQPDQMPYETASGCRLDGGDYPQMLRRAMENFDYEGARREIEAGRSEGRILGIGAAMGMDGCPINASIIRLINEDNSTSGDSEAAEIHIDETGAIVCATGSVPQGQGFETTCAQIVAEELGVTPDEVRVRAGFDSATHPYTGFSGTYASRFAIVGAGAVLGAAQKVSAKIKAIAAHLLEASDEDLELIEGEVRVRGGGPSAAMTLREIARIAWRDLASLPEELEAGIHAHYVYRPKFDMPMSGKRGNFSFTYSYGITLVLAEIDPGTGKVTIRRMVALDDFGRTLNPMIVEGQIHGSIAHQLGAALYENFDYSSDGRLASTDFRSYWAPAAADFPEFDVEYFETPSTATPLGTRGGGEGGGSPLIATVNAVDNALAPLGGHVRSSFLAPEVILREIKRSSQALA
jgi:2-furoyl-CoA dehydrogenase large subunit